MRDVGNLANGKTAKAKVVNWEETEGPVAEEPLPFLVTTFLSHERARGAEAGGLDEGVCVTPETVEGNKEDCSSKFVDELCTVSCVSGNSNSVDVPQIFLGESNESLLHIFGPEKLTSVADVCSYVPNLDNSVVSDCGDKQLLTGDTGTAGCPQSYVLGVGDGGQYRANVLLLARWCCVRNTACLRAFAKG